MQQETYPMKRFARLNDGTYMTTHADHSGQAGMVLDLTITFRLTLGDILTGITDERVRAIVLTANDNAFRRLRTQYGPLLALRTPEQLSRLLIAELVFLIKCGFYYGDLEAICTLRRA